jgi:hypothetical protein
MRTKNQVILTKTEVMDYLRLHCDIQSTDAEGYLKDIMKVLKLRDKPITEAEVEHYAKLINIAKALT